MKTQKKTKPKCISGTPCGYTCISGKKRCSDRVLERDAKALVESATKKGKADIPDVEKETIAAKADAAKLEVLPTVAVSLGMGNAVDGLDLNLPSGEPFRVYFDRDASNTWAQNNSGMTVPGYQSRSVSNSIVAELEDDSVLIKVLESVRANENLEGVTELTLSFVRENTNPKIYARYKKLEEAGIVSTFTTPSGYTSAIVNFDDQGRIRKATQAELDRIPKLKKADALRDEQSTSLYKEHDNRGLSDDKVKAIHDRESSDADKVQAVEDDLYGRKPNRTATREEYVAKAKAWSKSQGFKDDGGDVNGFSAEQAALHDIAHPATHDLVGLDSKGINKYFGELKTASGKSSLLGEEAIVNAVEHLSRGDSLEDSVMSAVRVARMLSRDGADDEKAYVRSPKFLRDLSSLAEKALKADNYGTITKVVRESNWKSGTVTQKGNI